MKIGNFVVYNEFQAVFIELWGKNEIIFILFLFIKYIFLKERRLREEAQNAAIRFERANSMHAVAKQQVKLTQDSLNRQRTIEPECLEVKIVHTNSFMIIIFLSDDIVSITSFLLLYHFYYKINSGTFINKFLCHDITNTLILLQHIKI